MRRMLWMAFVVCVFTVLEGCTNIPQNSHAWLSYKFSTTCDASSSCYAVLANPDPAQAYYHGLGIADPDNYSFDQWLSDQGFPADGSSDVEAIYANLADLQFGREMHCSQIGQKISCYVKNFGQPPMTWGWGGHSGEEWVLNKNNSWPNITDAVQAPFLHSPFGTVAMTYDPSITGPNQVTFYAFGTRFTFDGDGNPVPHDNTLLYSIALDQEGQKSVPRMCMACHGGSYDAGSNTATGASFLPFDVFAFRYPDGQPGYGFDDQQESFRKLNAMVVATNPNHAIVDLINGMYPMGVSTTGSEATDGWVPPGWSANPVVYTSVIRPYCRTCHLAQGITLDDGSTFQDLAGTVNNMVCTQHDMPHSQVPFGIDGKKVGFWNDRVAQGDLGSFLKSAGTTSCLPTN